MLQVFVGIVLFVVHGNAFAVSTHPYIVRPIAIKADDHIAANAIGISILVCIPGELFCTWVEPVQTTAVCP